MRRIAFLLAILLAIVPVGTQAQELRPPVLSEKWIKEEAWLRFAPWNRKIYEVNAFINANPHEMRVEDGVLYIQEGSRSTSCTDYARSKQQMLKNLGIESEIVVVKLRKGMAGEERALHAYVRVQLGDNTQVVLDSRFRDPIGVKALQAAYEPSYVPRGPVFTINEVLTREAKAKKASPTERVQ